MLEPSFAEQRLASTRSAQRQPSQLQEQNLQKFAWVAVQGKLTKLPGALPRQSLSCRNRDPPYTPTVVLMGILWQIGQIHFSAKRYILN